MALLAEDEDVRGAATSRSGRHRGHGGLQAKLVAGDAVLVGGGVTTGGRENDAAAGGEIGAGLRHFFVAERLAAGAYALAGAADRRQTGGGVAGGGAQLGLHGGAPGRGGVAGQGNGGDEGAACAQGGRVAAIGEGETPGERDAAPVHLGACAGGVRRGAMVPDRP